MPYLIMSRDSKDYRVVQFADSVRIGRAQDNDVVLNDEADRSVSRHHAYVALEGDAYILYDRSKNGTFVDDTRIEMFSLVHGTTFHIVNNLFTFIDEKAADQIRPRVTWGRGAFPEDETGEETLVPIGEVFQAP